MTNSASHRPIRSFVRRQGRITAKQAWALEQLWPKYHLDANKDIDFNNAFGREAPNVLEIGFGMGHSLHQMALEHAQWNFIGVEVHRPGIGALLLKLAQDQVDNVRIIEGDAVELLKQAIPDHSLDRVLIFFPDPWHKKRHHKRRLINSELLDLLAKKLKPGALLHCATDWENYAEQMRDLLNKHPSYTNQSPTQDYVKNNGLRPNTKFERRGERLGHGVWDLLFASVS